MCVCIELGDSFRRDPLVDRAVLSLGSSPNTYTRNAYCYFFLSDHVRTQEQSVARRVIRHLVAVFRHLGPLFAGFVRGPNPTKSPNSKPTKSPNLEFGLLVGFGLSICGLFIVSDSPKELFIVSDSPNSVLLTVRKN